MSRLASAGTRINERVPESVRPTLPLLAGLLLVLVGLQLGPFELSVLTQIVILGIFGMAYDLLLGYTGLLSFGHAAFFGLGTYTAVYTVNSMELSLLPVTVLVVVLAVVMSVGIGLIALQTTGVYFAMITLAIAQLIYLLTIRLGDQVGGASGLAMFARPETALPIDLGDDFQFFLFAVAVLVLSYYLMRRLLSSPMGDVFRAIRENEQRARMVGYDTFRYKLVSLAVSGVFSAIAGMLWGQFLYFASPRFLFWTTTGDVLLQTLFGGFGTLVGPIIGAAFVVLIEELLSPVTDQWLLFIGVAFVLVVIFLPHGIVGLFREEQ